MFNWLIGRRGFLAGVATFLANPFGILEGPNEDDLIKSLFQKDMFKGSKGIDYITMWNRITREPSLTLQYMLPAQLRKKDEHGNLVFTTDDPMEPPYRGNVHCYVCKKSNIIDDNNLELHMKSKHQLEWKSVYSHYYGYSEDA